MLSSINRFKQEITVLDTELIDKAKLIDLGEEENTELLCEQAHYLDNLNEEKNKFVRWV